MTIDIYSKTKSAPKVRLIINITDGFDRNPEDPAMVAAYSVFYQVGKYEYNREYRTNDWVPVDNQLIAINSKNTTGKDQSTGLLSGIEEAISVGLYELSSTFRHVFVDGNFDMIIINTNFAHVAGSMKTITLALNMAFSTFWRKFIMKKGMNDFQKELVKLGVFNTKNKSIAAQQSLFAKIFDTCIDLGLQSQAVKIHTNTKNTKYIRELKNIAKRHCGTINNIGDDDGTEI